MLKGRKLSMRVVKSLPIGGGNVLMGRKLPTQAVKILLKGREIDAQGQKTVHASS